MKLVGHLSIKQLNILGDSETTTKAIPVKFKIEVNQMFKDPLTRQAREGVRISNPADSAKVLNSKSEFNHPRLARLKIVS